MEFILTGYNNSAQNLSCGKCGKWKRKKGEMWEESEGKRLHSECVGAQHKSENGELRLENAEWRIENCEL